MSQATPSHRQAPQASAAAVPILALDVPSPRDAIALAERIDAARFVKVGLQLFTAAGPAVVRELRDAGRRVFLDLKLHDIPNTVAGAVASAADLGVDLLTVHASGGRAMLEAAARAAGDAGIHLLGVTVLTSLTAPELEEAWGRRRARPGEEAARLARLAAAAGLHGVVASVHEIAVIHDAAPGLRVLTPGIRLPGDDAGDQARVASPRDAAARGADYLVIGRTVTAAADPVAAFDRVLREIAR